jgi:hypothetical protein
VQYGSGVPSPAAAAEQARNDPQTAAAVMRTHPFEVEQIAMRFCVSRATAAMMLLAQMSAQPMPAMAQGGQPEPGSPVIVGEHGPEVFVPNMPGTIVPIPRAHPLYGGPNSGLHVDLGHFDIPPPGHGGPWEWQYGTLFPGAEYTPEERSYNYPYGPRSTHVDPAAWDPWLESRPESANIEERRTPEGQATDNRLMAQWNRNVPWAPKTRWQFPSIEEEDAWLATRRKEPETVLQDDLWNLKAGETTKRKR